MRNPAQLRSVGDSVQNLDRQCHERRVSRNVHHDHQPLGEELDQVAALILGASQMFQKLESQ